MNEYLRRVLKRLVRPLIAKLEAQERVLRRLEHAVGRLDRKMQDSWHDHNLRSDDLKVLFKTEQRTAVDAADVLLAGIHAMRADVDALIEWGSPASLARLRSGDSAAVDVMVAEALNRANGPDGFADRAGLWFRPAVQVTWAPGRVFVTGITGRIVAVPFVLRVLAELPPHCEVLDLANGDLSLDLAIAAMGHRVSIADRERLPLEHPGLAAIPLEDNGAQGEMFDAVFAVATEDGDIREDRVIGAMSSAEVRARVRPNGLMVLAASISGSATGNGAVMRETEIAAAMGGWKLVECAFARRRDHVLWEFETTGEDETNEPRVALLAARRTD